jgi:hypothetical protein
MVQIGQSEADVGRGQSALLPRSALARRRYWAGGRQAGLTARVTGAAIETPGLVTVLTPLDPGKLAQIQVLLGRNKKIYPCSTL